MNPAIAAGHQATLDAASEILNAGGNAFDAGIAAFIASFVAEPCMSSAGGGAFANVYQAGGPSLLFDFFCQTPCHRRPLSEVDFFPVVVNFGDTVETFHIGYGSTAVPGSIAGIFALHRQLATMPMKDLVQPAIQLAKEGVVVNRFQYYDFQLLEEILKQGERAQPIFFPNGPLIQTGEVMKMPHFADFLDYMAREGQDAFYQGEVAQKIVADYQEKGGFLSLEDFRNYEVIVRQPLRFRYRDRHILTNPLPGTGGAILAMSCGFTPTIPATETPGDLEHLRRIHRIQEQADRLDKVPAALAVELSNYYQSSPQGLQLIQERSDRKWGSTSHFNIVDRWGNAISLSTTNGEGCGYFVEGTDIQLNNMLGEAALLPSGFHSWSPNVRLSSMMTPTIVLDDKERLEMVLGSGGASRIPSAIFQVMQYLVDYQLPLAEAVNAPRTHLEHGVFNQEPGFTARLNESEIEQEQVVFSEPSIYFGGVHTICRKEDRFLACGDTRRDGVATD